jgi:AraC family transcriptional regulator, regulatory protein of adaptative response / DNA-3-methyladenine glycosylase II
MSENGERLRRKRSRVQSMTLSAAACYQAMKTRDARFDGHFFVGVTSTMIYCRPVCRVRLPLQKNCSFHRNAASAEQLGFRPCMKCRPELAPGVSAFGDSPTLAHAAAQCIDDSIGSALDLERIATRVGVTSRHLRRIFADEFGVTPVSYVQTRRLLCAKQLLTDTTLSVTEIAYASGFQSLRRMNALFAARYRFAPGQLRKSTQSKLAGDAHAFRFTLPYRPPYDWEQLLAFFRARAIPGVEHVSQETYARVVRIEVWDRKTGQRSEMVSWLSVAHAEAQASLVVSISPAFSSVLPQVLSVVRRVFDVSASPVQIAECLGALAHRRTGLRLPGAWDGFEIATRAILGQQVSVKAATTLASRLVAAFGESVRVTGVEPVVLSRCFPSATRVAALTVAQVAQLGVPSKRAQAIVLLAAAVASGALDLSPSAPMNALLTQLQTIAGIGAWTAQYIAMRALSWPDAWLSRDVAIQNALGLPNTPQGTREAAALAERWRPWRSYATLHLWNSL